MKTLLLILLLFSFQTFAQEDCNTPSFPELNDVLKLAKDIDWWSVSENDVKNAYCARKEPFSALEMNQWLQRNQSDLRQDETINGIAFQNESPENLEAFKYLTTAVGVLGEPIKEKAKNYSSSCNKVECALKEIFGDTSTQLLFMQRRYGMNGSHLAGNEASPWKKSELDDVLLSLSDFPEGILPVQKSRPLYHMPRTAGNGNTLANAVISVFGAWDKYSSATRRATITHELGHVIAGITDLDDHSEWMKHSDWEKTTHIVNGKEVEDVHAGKPETIVSRYGQENNWEDLAESVAAYRYNPLLLKEKSPEKYEMIKAVFFDNVEYTSEESCKNAKRLSHEIAKKVQDTLSESISDTVLYDMIGECNSQLIDSLAKNGAMAASDPKFKLCLEQKISNATPLMKDEVSKLPYAEFMGPMIRNKRVSIPTEFMSGLVSRSQQLVRKTFTDQIEKALKDSYTCRPGFLQYGYQKFDEKVLKVDTYRMRDQLNDIVKNSICPQKSKSAQEIGLALIP